MSSEVQGESDASQMITKRRVLSVTESAKPQQKGVSDGKVSYIIHNVTVAICVNLHTIRADRASYLALAAGPRVGFGHLILRLDTDQVQ